MHIQTLIHIFIVGKITQYLIYCVMVQYQQITAEVIKINSQETIHNITKSIGTIQKHRIIRQVIYVRRFYNSKNKN